MSSLKLFAPVTLAVYSPDDNARPRLKVYPDAAGELADSEPVLLPFRPAVRGSGAIGRTQVLERMRQIRRNQCCPACSRVMVEPRSTEQALRSRDQMPLPGAGELLGFRCGGCGHEWGIG